MTYNKIYDLIEDWDNIKLTCDVMPKSFPSKSDDLGELVDRFWESVFSSPDVVHPQLENDEEINQEDLD